MSHISRDMAPIFDAVLKGRVETLSASGTSVLSILAHLYNTATPTPRLPAGRPPPHPDHATDQAMSYSCRIKTLVIKRPAPYTDHQMAPPVQLSSQLLPLINNSALSGSAKYKLHVAMRRAYNSAFLRLLLLLLPELLTLEVEGDLTCLGSRHFFDATGALRTLRTLILTAIINKALTQKIHYFLFNTSLTTLIFNDSYILATTFGGLAKGSLPHITKLRFIRCQVSKNALTKILGACNELHTFEFVFTARFQRNIRVSTLIAYLLKIRGEKLKSIRITGCGVNRCVEGAGACMRL